MTSLLTKYVSERQRKGDFVTVWTPLTTLTVHWLSPLPLMSMCIKMKNALMAEYGLESDSALTDDGMNKLIIKGLITPLQMHLRTCAHTHALTQSVRERPQLFNVMNAFVIIINTLA